MATDDDCKRGTPRRKAERPTEILHAAFEEFVRTGYAATRLEDVAARAGVTKGTIYFHFQSKENVFNQMVRELSKPMHQRTQQFLDSNQQSGIEFLSAYLDFAYAEVLEDRHAREILRLLIAEATRFPDLVDEHFQYVLQPVFLRLQETLADATRDCQIRNSPAAQFPDLLLSPMLTLNIFLLVFADRKPIDPRKHLEAAKDLIFNGLLPRKT